MKKNKVVITGLSVLASNGLNKNEFWENCLNLKSNIVEIPSKWNENWNSKSKYWCPLPKEFPECLQSNSVDIGTKDLVQRIGLHLSRQLELDCGLDFIKIDNPNNSGVFIGTGLGGISTLERSLFIGFNEHQIKENPTHSQKSERFLRFTAPSIMPNSIAANIGIQYRFLGKNRTYSQACASGIVAIKEAFESIQTGKLKRAICGGIDYLHDKNGVYFHSFDILGVLNKSSNIDSISGPFDQDRSGFLFSEGGGALLFLETLEDAEQRGARIYCEIVDADEKFEANNIVEIEENGTSLKEMLTNLLAKNNVEPNQIGLVNAHGTGTILNDKIESQVYDSFFNQSTLITAAKSLTGHMLGTSSAVEVVLTALSLNQNVTPGNKFLNNSISKLFIPKNSEKLNQEYAIKTTLAFGGHDVCLLLKKYF